MTKSRFSRRSFLRGLGSTAVALPFLNAGLVGPAAAQPENASDGTHPKRFIVFYHPNGIEPDGWWPKTTGSDESEFELHGSLEPLQAFKDRLILTKGVHADSVRAGPGGPHQQGMGGILTGRPLQEGEMMGNDGSLAGWGDGISIDQAIAEKVGASTPFKSLQLGIRGDANGGSRVRTRLNYAGPGQPLPPQNDPRKVFDQIFSNFETEPDAHNEIRRKRASVLDTVGDQFRRLESRVSSQDWQKLQRHLQKVRDLEKRLHASSGGGKECRKPPRPPDREPNSEETMPEIMHQQRELAVLALACDLTRVVTLQVSNAVNNIRYPWIDSMRDGHALSHAGPTDENAKKQWIRRDKWHAEQVKYLLEELDAIPEGDGTMLDNTLLLWVQDVAVGNTHAHKDMPFVLAGNVGDQFRTGRYIEFSDKSHNDLLAALGKAYGLETDTFGDPEFSNGPLAGLT